MPARRTGDGYDYSVVERLGDPSDKSENLDSMCVC